MAEGSQEKTEKKQDNPYKSKVNKWVIIIAITIIIGLVLLLVFNRRSTVVNEEAESNSPIALTTTMVSSKYNHTI